MPIAVLHYEAVIGSFLGETRVRLAQVFAWARTRRCVLFLDELPPVGGTCEEEQSPMTKDDLLFGYA